jgi:hypothetical protein
VDIVSIFDKDLELNFCIALLPLPLAKLPFGSKANVQTTSV